MVTSSLMLFSLVGSTSIARQKGEDAGDTQAAVSRGAIREVASELSVLRDAMKGDVERLEREYLQACQSHVRGGGPRDEILKVDLEKQRKNLDRLVEQLKRLQYLAEVD